MAAKTEETTEKVEKNKDKKTTKKADKNKKTTKKADKFILSDLVEASNVQLTSIIMDLSKAGLLNQYYEELDKKRKGITLIPTITEAEFKKIIGD